MRHLLYWLKKHHGYPMTFHHIIGTVANVLTGATETDTIDYSINRGILLPIEVSREFAAKLRGSNYPYAAVYDRGRAVILVDRRDLPEDHELAVDDIIDLRDRQFKINNFSDLHDIACVEFIVTELFGEERQVI